MSNAFRSVTHGVSSSPLRTSCIATALESDGVSMYLSQKERSKMIVTERRKVMLSVELQVLTKSAGPDMGTNMSTQVRAQPSCNAK